MARRRRSTRHTTRRRSTHSTRHRSATGRHVPHPGARGKPHPHKGAHVPHPGARHPRTESAAQRAAAQRNLAKARIAAHLAHPAGQQTPRQLAAERASLVKARAARAAKAAGRVAGARARHKAAAHAARRRTTHPRTRHSPTAHRIRHTATRPATKHRTSIVHRVKHAPTVRPAVHRAAHAVHNRAVAHGARTHRVTRSRVARGHPIGVKVHHMPGLKGPKNHYNRRGLASTTHWIAGHRKPIRPKHSRWAWTVRSGRQHAWDWTRARKARQQW